MRKLASLLLCSFLAACSTELPASANENDALVSVGYNLASFADGFEPDGIAADQRLLFTCEVPSISQPVGVRVASRLSSVDLGFLPAPSPLPFAGPTGVEILNFTTNGLGTSGTLLVFDNGGLPPAPSVKFVAKYSYSYSPATGFSATLLAQYPLPVQTSPMPPITGFGFISDLHTLPDGTSVLTDPFIGDIWTCGPAFDDCQPVMFDADFAPAPAPTFTGTGRAPGGGTRPYTLQLSVGLSPGIVGAAYMHVIDSVCVGRTAQPGGIWCIDRTTLLDRTTNPTTKLKTLIQAPAIGVSDGGHGVAADVWHCDSPWLYWIRSYSDAAGGGVNKAFRVNVLTGEVQTILASNTLLDFGTGITVMPPLVDGSSLASIAIPSGQEENNGVLNLVLGGVDNFVAPTIITGVKLPAY